MILETHQGKGDGTEQYREQGCVVSFEKNRETYSKIRKRFRDAFSLDKCLEDSSELVEIAETCKTSVGYPILIPSFPTDSNAAMPRLISQNCRFDIVDIDPYGSPRQFISLALELLNDKSILLTTSGEMHSVRFQPQKSLTPYGIQANNRFKSTQRFFRTDNILVLGAWIVQRGLEKSFGLYPIFIYDYYTGHSGVQRIGFFVRRHINLNQRSEIRAQMLMDPFLKTKIVRCCFKRKANRGIQIPWRFHDDTSENEIRDFITSRLELLNKS